MKTTWQWSPEFEANRILSTCCSVASGFYKKQGFLVLPNTTNRYLLQAAYLPEINYNNIVNIWQLARDSSLTIIPTSDPHNLVPMITSLLPPLDRPDTTTLEQLWKKHGNQIISLLKMELNFSFKNATLAIYPTHYGTIGSFNHVTDKNHIAIWLRSDATIATLVETIISAVLRPLHHKQQLLWSESEAIIDHLINSGKLGKLLHQTTNVSPSGTLPSLRVAKQKELEVASAQFLANIGAPIDRPRFALDGDMPTVNDVPLHSLTAREKAIMTTLIYQSPKTVSYDEIANIIFTSDEDYSLATLTKVIDRLRSKIKKNSVSPDYLATDRSFGYFLQSFE